MVNALRDEIDSKKHFHEEKIAKTKSVKNSGTQTTSRKQ